MNSLVNSSFCRTYNPCVRQNALSDIKRLLTSRDTEAQNKACGYLVEVIGRYSRNSNEGARLVEYLLDNDITVFLCEATSNLDFSLFRSILACLRLLYREHRFFVEEHAAHAMTAVLRALAHYAGSGSHAAVDACLHFLCDLLNGVTTHKTTPPLSHQSAYSAIQLLSCLNALAPRINTNQNTILSSALVLHSLISYQPDSLAVKGNTAAALLEVLNQWFGLLMSALNHSMLVGDGGVCGLFLVTICQLGMDVLGLINLLEHGQPKTDFIQTILTDDQEIGLLKQCAFDMRRSIQCIVSDLVLYTKENQKQMSTEDYSVFLKFLLKFLYENEGSNAMDFCDMLFSKGYLTMLPQVQIIRNDATVRKVSTLVLGEMLKALSQKYLDVNNTQVDVGTCARDIHMGLIELQYGIEKPQSMGTQLQKSQPYSLLIYIYFYCQSSENPEEATAPLLPYLVEHILKLPKSFTPPSYIIKALWLVFAMSTISNGSLESLEERVYLEKASDRLVLMLYPDPSIYYTHNPAILLWAFTSQRIPNPVRYHVLSQWLKIEDSLPEDLTSEPVVWELLLNILTQSKNQQIITNCVEALHMCLKEGDDDERQEFALLVWSALPGVLSKALIDYEVEIDTNISHLLDIATTLPPTEVDQMICLKIAVLITTIFSKNAELQGEASENRCHFEFVCLKLCLYLLGLANNQNDNRVLLTYVNRVGFLPSVLSATNSLDDRVACVAMQLLSYVVHYFVKNNYQPKTVLEMQSHLVIKSLRRDSSSERGSSLLQLVYMVLSSGRATPLVLGYDLEPRPLLCNALRALMFRIQLMPKTVLEIQTHLVIKSLRRDSSSERGSSLLQLVYMVLSSGRATPLVLGYDLEPGPLLCNALRALMFRIQLMLCCRESNNQSLAGWKTLSAIFKHAIVTKNDSKLVAILTSQPWTHTLIQFQLTQNITEEFLTFTYNWITLLKVTIKKNQEEKRSQLSKQSLIIKTMMLMKKHLVIEEDNLKEVKMNTLVIVKDILELSNIRLI